MYVIDRGNRRIQVFDLVGNFLFKWGSHGVDTGYFTYPNGIDMDSNGNICILDEQGYPKVQIFDRDGNYINTFGSYGIVSPGFNLARDVQIDSNGLIYIANMLNNVVTVYKFDVTPPVLNMEIASNQIVYSSLQQLSAKFTDNLIPITSVEYKIGDGEWKSCTALSGEFTLLEEDFVCDFSSDINEDGEYTIFIRGQIQRQIYQKLRR